MNGLVSEAHKTVLVISGLLCLLIIVLAFTASVWPKQENTFIELGLLGKDKTADAYFINAYSIVEIGDVNSWYIYVHNHMKDSQVVSIRAKLLNASSDLPDNRRHQPSAAGAFAEFPLILTVNETVLVPFSWSILNAESQNGSITIKRLLVNEQPVEVAVSNSANSSFNIVFELWVRDVNSGNYTFGFRSQENSSSVSIYMGFRLNRDDV